MFHLVSSNTPLVFHLFLLPSLLSCLWIARHTSSIDINGLESPSYGISWFLFSSSYYSLIYWNQCSPIVFLSVSNFPFLSVIHTPLYVLMLHFLSVCQITPLNLLTSFLVPLLFSLSLCSSYFILHWVFFLLPLIHHAKDFLGHPFLMFSFSLLVSPPPSHI